MPIRVYNHVEGTYIIHIVLSCSLTENNYAVGHAPRPYDLLWPVARRQEKMTIGRVDEVKKDKFVVKLGKISSRYVFPACSNLRSKTYRVSHECAVVCTSSPIG